MSMACQWHNFGNIYEMLVMSKGAKREMKTSRLTSSHFELFYLEILYNKIFGY